MNEETRALLDKLKSMPLDQSFQLMDIIYWTQRCRAAEKFIEESMPAFPSESETHRIWKEWVETKPFSEIKFSVAINEEE